MKPELRAKIITYNRQRVEDRRKADDLLTLLFTFPRSPQAAVEHQIGMTTGSPSEY